MRGIGLPRPIFWLPFCIFLVFAEVDSFGSQSPDQRPQIAWQANPARFKSAEASATLRIAPQCAKQYRIVMPSICTFALAESLSCKSVTWPGYDPEGQ